MAKEDLRKEVPETTLMGVEEATAKELLAFGEPKGDKLYTQSDITPKEVFALNLIKIFGEKFNSKITDGWLRTHLLLRVSLLRRGRKETMLITTGLREAGEARRGKKGLEALFGGLR